ncbi:hypothetical protein ANCDUO_07996 [Ancylostoma duodenale]|uniref:Uncharacterized protein n=1 Tax=Ancylostoma duodenale TaxID=51022 RepID=A0A0C2DGZ9_9BILA|nr:hypothetical protein ANCDUO_07996 [Ancylostoma duodenale]
MLEKIQYERKFESNGFAVVLKMFTNNVLDVIRNKFDETDNAFYAEDLFHLSKYGNSVFAIHLWNSLFDPVGHKGFGVNFSDTSVTLKCPSKVSFHILFEFQK